MAQSWWSGKFGLEVVKGTFTIFVPIKLLRYFVKLRQGFYYTHKVSYKLSVKATKLANARASVVLVLTRVSQ